MYISLGQANQLDNLVKGQEVAIRSFAADIITNKYKTTQSFKSVLESIKIPENIIYSKRLAGKLKGLISRSTEVYNILLDCRSSANTGTFNNNVPYLSEIFDLILILFNSDFANKDIARKFSSIEEFHYCCSLFHKVRNDLSHPASHPITPSDADKVIFFISNLCNSIDNKYYWHATSSEILNGIKIYENLSSSSNVKCQNLALGISSHKRLVCRENIIDRLYKSLFGGDNLRRVFGSVVLYGYGGVGKTSITAEFLYRTLRDKLDGKHEDLEYLLFFSSKDEHLNNNNSTGELYIDSVRPEFSTFDELKNLLLRTLGISCIEELASSFKRGIIAIDNLENIETDEKEKIINFIRTLPREVQFIVTSRVEEMCEEKIHIEEFKNDETGHNFIRQLIESEEIEVYIDNSEIESLLHASKGNALIILQTLNIVSRGVTTFSNIFESLESMRSRNTEIIANFMYKNTFDDAFTYLKSKGLRVEDVVQIISLYDEKIELYSISKLVKIDIADAEQICNYLLGRLVLKKTGEYYELNEFAKRFIFIKLLPDRLKLAELKGEISAHKSRMRGKLEQLDSTLNTSLELRKNVTDWQPRNYIDKIVIAELFSLYGDAIKCLRRGERTEYEKYLKEFDDHQFISRHPFVPHQKARILKEGLKKFYNNDKMLMTQVEQLYEEAIESIEYEYRYLMNGEAYASLLMLFGVFLSQQLKQYSRAIRFLESACTYFNSPDSKAWSISRVYLSESYLGMYQESKREEYIAQLKIIYREVTLTKTGHKFNKERYTKKFSSIAS